MKKFKCIKIALVCPYSHGTPLDFSLDFRTSGLDVASSLGLARFYFQSLILGAWIYCVDVGYISWTWGTHALSHVARTQSSDY